MRCAFSATAAAAWRVMAMLFAAIFLDNWNKRRMIKKSDIFYFLLLGIRLVSSVILCRISALFSPWKLCKDFWDCLWVDYKSFLVDRKVGGKLINSQGRISTSPPFQIALRLQSQECKIGGGGGNPNKSTRTVWILFKTFLCCYKAKQACFLLQQSCCFSFAMRAGEILTTVRSFYHDGTLQNHMIQHTLFNLYHTLQNISMIYLDLIPTLSCD